MTSAKNKLQEFLQKNKLPLPKYETERIGGPDNDPIFRTTIWLDEYTICGDPAPNKMAAQQSAANSVLNIIAESKSLKIKSNVSTSRYVVWVDEENMSGEHFKLRQNELNVPVISVASKKWGKLTDDTIVAGTTHKNGADVGLIMRITKYLIENDRDEIHIILSRDSFASAAVDLINNNFLNLEKPVKAHNACTAKEVLDIINS